MNKRGQVTVFIILGMVILIILALALFFRGEISRISIGKETREKFVSTQVEPLRDHIEECIEETGDDVMVLIGKQGGDLNPGLYRNYFGDKLTYLCYSDNFSACYNRRPFLLESMEGQITDYVYENLDSCLDLSPWEKRGVIITKEDYEITTTMGDYNVIVVVDYPMTLTKGDFSAEENRFSHTFNIPLGRLGRVAMDVVDSEITIGDFFNVPYEIKNSGNFRIEKQDMGDDRVYILSAKNYNYVFQFAVQGWVY
jgi:hypothetical protein